MLGPLHLPHVVARTLTVSAARLAKHAGRALTPIASRLPIGPRAIALVSHSGFMLPVQDPEIAARAISEFLTTPVDWYMHLALRTSEHGRVSLSAIRVPATFVAGKWDVLAGSRDMRTAADRIPGARFVELPGSHFLNLEHPDEVHALLLELLQRVS
jgi:pimeloyl-ACP methyl ester carboxylesterase